MENPPAAEKEDNTVESFFGGRFPILTNKALPRFYNGIHPSDGWMPEEAGRCFFAFAGRIPRDVVWAGSDRLSVVRLSVRSAASSRIDRTKTVDRGFGAVRILGIASFGRRLADGGDRKPCCRGDTSAVYMGKMHFEGLAGYLGG